MVNVQEAVDTSLKARDRFLNKKAEYFWYLRERFFEGRIRGLVDETTIAQLTAIRYGHDSRGRIAIETKDELKKRGVKSPDRAEGLVLAFAPVRSAWAGLRDYYEAEQKPQETEECLVTA